MVIDTASLVDRTDLNILVEATLHESGKKKGRWTFWSCPFHAGDNTPSLGVCQEEGRWFCFACRKGGDAITWLMDLQGLSFKDACDHLGTQAFENPTKASPYTRSKKHQPQRPDGLQEVWAQIIAKCEGLLWDPIGSKALAYLHDRGIHESTLRSPYFRIGYSPGIKIADIWVDRGIVIPCFTTSSDLGIDYISYVKIRRPDGKPKYKKLPGKGANLTGLFGANWAYGADIVFLTEGEFDAMLLHQQAGDLVGVCTLGGASDRPNFAHFGKYILAAKHVIIAYDRDDAGNKGSEIWRNLSARVHCAQIPQGKDITEFWQSGGDLSDWVMEVLKNLGIA